MKRFITTHLSRLLSRTSGADAGAAHRYGGRDGGPCHLIGRLASAAVASCLPLANVSAQATPIAECTAPCPLFLELVGTFGDDEGPGMLGDYVRGFPGNNGRWYLVDRPPTEVKVYDGAGAFLHRFGRSGEGPGEFSLIRYVLPIGDSVVTTRAGSSFSTRRAISFVKRGCRSHQVRTELCTPTAWGS